MAGTESVSENGATGDSTGTGQAVDRIGYLYLAGTVVFNGTAFHFIKAGLRHVPSTTAMLITSASAVAGIVLAGAVARLLGVTGAGFSTVTPASILQRTIQQWQRLLPATVIGMLGGWLGYVTIGRYGPELTAFLSNMTLVMLVLGGVMRGDRLAAREWAYIAMVLAGVFLFSWRGQDMAWLAIGIMVLCCLFNTIKQIAIKEAVPGGSLWDLMAGQQALFTVWALVLTLSTGAPILAPLPAYPWLVTAGILQNFLGMSLLYAGYTRVGVARGAPIYAMRPLTVLLIGLAIGTAHPGLSQYLGGALLLAGSALLARHRPASRTRRASGHRRVR